MPKKERDSIIQEEIDRVTMSLIKKPHKMEEIFKTSFLTTEEKLEALQWAFRLRDKIDNLLEVNSSKKIRTEDKMTTALYTEIEELMQKEWVPKEQKKELKRTLFLLRSTVYETYADLLIRNIKSLLKHATFEVNYLHNRPRTYKLYIFNQLVRGFLFGSLLGFTVYTLFIK